MRSKLGTRARLAAHIAALILLILMLVYLDSPKQRGLDWRSLGAIRPADGGVSAYVDPAATLTRLAAPGRAEAAPEENLRPPTAAEPAPIPEPIAEPVVEETPVPESVPLPEPEPAPVPESEPVAEPVAATPPAPEAPPLPEPPAVEPTPIAEPIAEPVVEAAPVPETATVAETEPVPEAPPSPAPTPEPIAEPIPEPIPEPVPEADSPPLPAQPDESGAIVVAADSTAASGVPAQAAAPLPNANLEVLAGGVYWLAPGRDLAEELSAVPDLASLILLTPLPGYSAPDFTHVRATSIPADVTDLSADAAERFLHLLRTSPRPVVAAALPGARGAAFFKGAYLIRERAMSLTEATAALEAELAPAGAGKDEIMHRLAALAPQPVN